jgi:hypothetical protein
MEHSLFIAIIVGIGLLIGMLYTLSDRKRFQKYWTRKCTGHQWRRLFPDSSKEDIRSFLEIFVDSFCFNRSKCLKFSPSDKLIEIYRTHYPSDNAVDFMEIEAFLIDLERNYGKDVADVITAEMTLRDIFDITRRENPNKQITI